jgi:hypothetical protein
MRFLFLLLPPVAKSQMVQKWILVESFPARNHHELRAKIRFHPVETATALQSTYRLPLMLVFVSVFSAYPLHVLHSFS